MNATATTLPLSSLIRSPKNVRPEAKHVEALAASIAAQGLLQNLVVSSADDGRYHVEAGSRRLAALQLLASDGRIAEDFAVPVLLVDAENGTAVSLAENVMREAMHPADEFDAFAKLVGERWSIDRIADAFGVTPLVVERRLTLMKAAPELIEAFRQDEIATDQLMALCATDDHERQIRVWRVYGRQNWNNSPRDLRRAVLDEEIDASTDRRVAFIGGLDVYRAAGGAVRRDLFGGDGSGGFLTDGALLDQLVSERLEREAEALRAEGWGWVEIWPRMEHTPFQRLGRAPQAKVALSDQQAAQVTALETERDTLLQEQEAMHEAAEDGDGELSDEQWQRDSEIDDRVAEIQEDIERIEAAGSSYAPEVIAKSGALVIYDDGKARIERGLVRAADRKAVASAAGDAGGVAGGRESEPAGRKKGDALSDALRRSLLGHRNLAAQIETAQAPAIAKVVLACWTVLHIRSSCGKELRYDQPKLPTDFSNAANAYSCHPITDEAGKTKLAAFKTKALAAVGSLPKSGDALWDALMVLTGEALDAIIAYGVALSLNIGDDNKGLTGKLIEALGFDMADHFAATTENYLGRVAKTLMVEAVSESGKITDQDDKAALLAMKKSECAQEAERRLKGSGWVPKLIRTAKPKQPTKAKPAKKVTKAVKAVKQSSAKPAKQASKPAKQGKKKAA